MLYVVRHGKKAELVTLSDMLYFIHDEPEEFIVQKEELRKERNGLAGLTRWEDKVDFRAWLPLCPISPQKVLSPIGILPTGDSFRILLSSSKHLVVFIRHSHVSMN